MKKRLISIALAAFFTSQSCFSQQGMAISDFSMGSRASDSLALMAFNHSTLGYLWKEKWDFNAPMDEWFGVHLNASGRVFCLDLDGDPQCTASRYGGNHLHGALPDLQLPFLEHLFLSSNKIAGRIPNFSGMPYLLTLQLSANEFSGPIPNFYYLEYLIKIDLEYNRLSGSVPEFETLFFLETIYLGHNELKGPLPLFEFSDNLRQLYAEHNQLTSCPNEFGHLSELRQLILCDNNISGLLPSFVNNQNLEHLDISSNNFQDCFVPLDYAHINYFNAENNQIIPCPTFEVYIPNAFSPNGDGINDYFELSFSSAGILNHHVTLKVWDTKKRLIYSSTDYNNDWGGQSLDEGQSANDGTYFYQIKIDHEEIKTGYLKILVYR